MMFDGEVRRRGEWGGTRRQEGGWRTSGWRTWGGGALRQCFQEHQTERGTRQGGVERVIEASKRVLQPSKWVRGLKGGIGGYATRIWGVWQSEG